MDRTRRSERGRPAAVVAAAGAAAALAVAAIGAALALRRTGAAGRRRAPGVARRSRTARNLEVARLALHRGVDEVATRARLRVSPAHRHDQLRLELQRRHAAEVVSSLGLMKGALMKIGQMASYLDEGMPEHVRAALAQLQQDAPPMEPLLAVSEIERELGGPLRRFFDHFDEEPIAAASIGQVHAAVTRDGQDVVVKVQYPGIADAIAADLDNTELLGTILGAVFGALEPGPLVAELRRRIGEELDYRVEASNQMLFADYYRGHPTIAVPDVRLDLSSRRVLVSARAHGARLDEVEDWPQSERDLAAECIFRFVFRSLYRLRAFNGDPHPGNYLFRPGGHITFLDFGLVKRFEPADTGRFQALITAMIAGEAPAFRAAAESAGLLRPGAPFSDAEIIAWFEHFYEIVRHDRPVTITREYASSVVRHTFDRRQSAILQWANVPPNFALIQRINLGLFAVLARLRARAHYRRVAQELWPWTDAPPSTPMGEAEAVWLADLSDRAGTRAGS